MHFKLNCAGVRESNEFEWKSNYFLSNWALQLLESKVQEKLWS